MERPLNDAHGVGDAYQSQDSASSAYGAFVHGADDGADFARLMEPVARELLGEPREKHHGGREWRYGSRGSLSVRIDTGTWHDHESNTGGGTLALIQNRVGLDRAGALAWLLDRKFIEDRKRAPVKPRIVATYDYADADGVLSFQVVRFDPKDFRQRRPDKGGGWVWKMQGVQLVPFRLPELVEAIAKGRTVYIAEGEKGVLSLVSIGLDATCSPGGACKWRPAYAAMFAGADVVILPDNDKAGSDHAEMVSASLRTVARSVRVVSLPGLPPKGDVADWIAAGGTAAELARLVDGAGNAGATPPERPEEPAADEDLPTIKLHAGDVETVVSLAEAALIANPGRRVFQRGGMVVGIGNVQVITAGKKEVSSQRIVPRTEPAMFEDMSASADWRKYDGRSKSWEKVRPPGWAVQVLMAREGRLRLPVLAGVLNAPTLRADGSILSTPGYDEASGLFYDPRGTKFPPVPDRPTKDQAAAALMRLQGLIETFPFVDDAARSVALSAMLTAVIRKSLRTSPLHAYTAPAAGSGKSLLVDLASILATGREAGVIAQGKTEEEFEKRLGSMLLAGDPVFAIDNCEAALGGELLCQALTQTKVKVRVLGRSETPDLSTDSLIVATGNNLRLVGDMPRRSLVCRIDAGVERPELRTFALDPIAAAKGGRAGLTVDALTVLRAYHVAGRPDQPAALGSFADWSGWVRAALIWLGRADPVDTTEVARAMDERGDAVTAVLAQWRAALGYARVSARDVIAAATETRADAWGNSSYLFPDFREALLTVAGEGGAINSRKLGKWLMATKDRVVKLDVTLSTDTARVIEDVRIHRAGMTDGLTTWQMVKAPRS